MKKLFIIVVLLNGCTFSNASTSLVVSTKYKKTVDEMFIEYKQDTLALINRHNLIHPDCILNKLRIEELYIQSVKIYNTRYEAQTLAYCFPYNLDDTIFIKRNYKWKKKKATITIIHEALHMRFICKPDAIYTGQSLCKLWNVNAYTSQDISLIIEAHLDKELNK